MGKLLKPGLYTGGQISETTYSYNVTAWSWIQQVQTLGAVDHHGCNTSLGHYSYGCNTSSGNYSSTLLFHDAYSLQCNDQVVIKSTGVTNGYSPTVDMLFYELTN